MAHEIHLGEDPVQSSNLQTMSDLTVRQSELAKLSVRHRAVLLLGECGDALVRVT